LVPFAEDDVDEDDVDEESLTRMSWASPPLMSASTKNVLSQKWNSLLDLRHIFELRPTKSSFGFVRNSILNQMDQPVISGIYQFLAGT
jgi:hypothetical protein